jgi:polysaccharide biosynthesis transport protein
MLIVPPVLPPPRPQVEILTTAPVGFLPPTSLRRRLWVFLAVLGTALALGLTLDLARPAVYRSSATVLTVAPRAVDQKPSNADADPQHAAIQRQLLLGEPLLRQTLARLEAGGEARRFGIGRVSDFDSLLSVTRIPDTQLLSLSAEGPSRALLAPLVNAWIKSYLAYREQAVQHDVGDTLAALGHSLGDLDTRLTQKRAALDAFRIRNGILSDDDTANQAHARLTGLNDSLNKAREAQATARAQLKALREAIAQGAPVVPDSERSELLKLQVKAAKLRDELDSYQKRYTPEYMLVDRKFSGLPQQLTDLEADIHRRLAQGQQMLLAQARQALDGATATVIELEQQLAQHQREAADLTARFAEYQALTKDLEALEQLRRDTEKRQAEIQAKSLERYPQVQVVDWAYPPKDSVYPDYQRDALVALGVSLGLALLAVMLVEYLAPRGRDAGQAAPVTGIRLFGEGAPPLPAGAGAASPAALVASHGPALISPSPPALPRELTAPEVEALWRCADPPDRRLLGLLLAGLALEEIVLLPADAWDAAAGLLRVGARTVPLATAVIPLLPEPTEGEPAELAARLRLLAHDTGLPYPEQVDAEALRHTYILFLVRQGARLRDLAGLVGPLPAQRLAAYGPYSPRGPGRPLQDLEPRYPLSVSDTAAAA